MSLLLTRTFRLRLFLVALCVAGTAGMMLWPLEANRGTTAPREIVLIAHEMAFYLEGDATPNPAIHVTRGEEIALTLRNEDAGITHDFSVMGWGVQTRKLKGSGVARIVFTAPDTAGNDEYMCTPHSLMMRGSIVVE